MKQPTFPPAALAQHVAIVGKTGSGKTSTAKLAIEQVVAEGSRVCVLDPVKSDWWGVISSTNGKHPGLPFHVLGGPRAHVALHSGAGAAIAELVARGDLPLSVLDMAEFEPGGQQRFFVAFADTLLKRMRGVLYLVLEEAHEFAPKERAGFEKENLSIHYAKKLATAGRSKGIRLIIATQRTQSLHNALLGSCDTLIAHRLTAPADQEPVTKWLKGNVEKGLAAQVASELASLKTGTGWLCSGEAKAFERIHFPRISTFDNSATPTDDADELQVKSGDVDMDALRALIGTAVVEAEANDPKRLRARIKELERSQRTLDTAGMIAFERAEDLVRQAEQRVREEFEGLAEERAAAAVADLRHTIYPHVQGVGAVLEALEGPMEALRAAIRNGTIPPTGETKPPVRAPIASIRETKPATRETPAPRPAPKRRETPTGDVAIGKTPRRMIDAMAALHQLGVEEPSRSVVAGWVGISPTTGTFTTYLGRLRTAGLVEDLPEMRLALTELGHQEATPPPEIPTLEELHGVWISKLGATPGRMLQVIAAAYPNPVDREDLANAVGVSHTTGTFTTYLGRLRSPGLIRDVSKGGPVVATDVLFPAGLTR